MSIRRIDVGPRMSQIVIHGNTVYLAGQVGEPGGNVASQTRDILKTIARSNRLDVATWGGRWACLGVYASVVQPGTVSVGDPVRLH